MYGCLFWSKYYKFTFDEYFFDIYVSIILTIYKIIYFLTAFSKWWDIGKKFTKIKIYFYINLFMSSTNNFKFSLSLIFLISLIQNTSKPKFILLTAAKFQRDIHYMLDILSALRETYILITFNSLAIKKRLTNHF